MVVRTGLDIAGDHPAALEERTDRSDQRGGAERPPAPLGAFVAHNTASLGADTAPLGAPHHVPNDGGGPAGGPI